MLFSIQMAFARAELIWLKESSHSRKGKWQKTAFKALPLQLTISQIAKKPFPTPTDFLSGTCMHWRQHLPPTYHLTTYYSETHQLMITECQAPSWDCYRRGSLLPFSPAKQRIFLHSFNIKKEELINAFWDTGRARCINKYITLDPTMTIHVISLMLLILAHYGLQQKGG